MEVNYLMTSYVSRRFTMLTLMLIGVVVVLVATGCKGATHSSANTTSTESGINLTAQCPGPAGDPAASPNELKLTAAEVQRVRKGHYKAAVTWAGPGPWYAAVDNGFSDALKYFNITRVVTAEAEYDPAKQAAQVSTVMAKNPDVVLGSPVDANAAATAYREVVRAHKVLVLSDNVPTGYKAGVQYVGFVSGDRCEGAKLMADQIAKAIHGSGDIGMIYYDQEYYVTNVLDNYFKANIAERYPNIHIVAAKGFSNETQTQDIASALIKQHPSIKAIYVTWSIPAEGAIAALRAASRTDVKIITHDLDSTNDVNLAAGQGPMYATVVEDLHSLGYNLGVEAAYGLLHKKAPAFVAVPYILATPKTIVAAYPKALNIPAPNSVKKAAH
jgi:ribose transport system substrate-binding protein